jgi:hypothetical protein
LSPPTLSRARAFTRAGLDSHGQRVGFHSLREYLFDRLTAVASIEKAKQIIGKKVSDADQVYLGVENLRDIYQRAMPSIVVGNGNGTETKKRVDNLEEENKKLREQIEGLQMSLENLSTNKRSVLKEIAQDAEGLTTEDLKLLKQMALEFASKKKRT